MASLAPSSIWPTLADGSAVQHALEELAHNTAVFLPSGIEVQIIEARRDPRTCHYCSTAQVSGVDCTYCGAPDDGDRGPLAMAPIRVVTA
jgi:hypothetical protein